MGFRSKFEPFGCVLSFNSMFEIYVCIWEKWKESSDEYFMHQSKTWNNVKELLSEWLGYQSTIWNGCKMYDQCFVSQKYKGINDCHGNYSSAWKMWCHCMLFMLN